MRKGSSGLDQAGAGTVLASVRSASGLGRRTPKKNARKRIILQEKISRELSASRNKVNDGQANVHRCVSLAASLQDQLIELAHKLKDTLNTDAGAESPGIVSELVDQLCQVQLLHQAVHHSLELLQNAADKLLHAERTTHALESNTCSSPGTETAAKVPASAPPPAVLANYGHLDAGAFFSAAADAPVSASNAPDSNLHGATTLSQRTVSQGGDACAPHMPTASPSGCRPSPLAARMSSCSSITDIDTSRMSQPLPVTLVAESVRGEEEDGDFFSRSCSAQMPTHWAAASGASPWLSCALEPAPSAPSPSVWQMTDAERLHAQRAMSRTRTAGAGATVEDSPVVQPSESPAVHTSGAPPSEAQLQAERSLSAPLRPPNLPAAPSLFERVHSSEVATSSAIPARCTSVSGDHMQYAQQGTVSSSGAMGTSYQAAPPHTTNNVNAWLQDSSSEDESEDPRADNTASLMLNLLAPGVPPNILHSLSLSNPPTSDTTTTLHARGSAGLQHMGSAAHALHGPQSSLAMPSPAFSRSRSDADAMLSRAPAGPGPTHSGNAALAHMLRASMNGPLQHTHAQGARHSARGALYSRHNSSGLVTYSDIPDLSVARRMPSEHFLEEINSQAHAVVSALHAAFSSLERVSLHTIRRTADEIRVSAPFLNPQPPKAPPYTNNAPMHAQHSWSPWSSATANFHNQQPPAPGPGLSGGPLAQSGGVWPGPALGGVAQDARADFHRMASAPHPHSHHASAPGAWGQGMSSHSSSHIMPEREQSMPFPSVNMSSHMKQPLLQHNRPSSGSGNTAPRQWQPFISEFALASSNHSPQPPPQQQISPKPPQHHQLAGAMSHPAHRLPSVESLHLPPPHLVAGNSGPPGPPPFDLMQRHPSDNTSSLASAFAEHLLRAFSCNATEAAKRSQSSGPAMGFDSPASHMHVHAGEWPQGPHVSTMVFPRCEICAVRSNSAKSLTAHLESKGTANVPSNTSHGNTNHSSNANVTGAQGGKSGAASKEEGSATLMQYRKQLPDVRVADEATSKDVLGLLFQLVQMQIRKAEKFRESLPRAHKRCLAGMKEVAWAVSKAGQAKLVLIAPNIQIPCPDSILLAQVRDLVGKCRDVGVPVIMGPSRKQLGMAFRTSEGSKSTFKLMSAVALLDISGAEPQWGDIMARFTTLPLAADFEDPLEDAGPPRSLTDAPPGAPASTLQSHISAPVLGQARSSREGALGGGNGFSGAIASPASAQAAGVNGTGTGNSVDKRSMVPMAAAVVDRLKRSGWDAGWPPQQGPAVGPQHNTRSFQEILEGASVLLAQVVSLGSLLGSSGGRMHNL